MNKRVALVNEIQAMLEMTNYDDVMVQYGYIDNNGKFTPSNRDVNRDPDKRETVLVKYFKQDDEFGILQSIEADSTFAIVKDVIKAVDRL